MQIKISVVMPICGDDFDRISQSILSIFNQTFQEYELIIVLDDPGNKQLCELVSSLCSQRDTKVTIITNSSQKGVAESLNIGIKNSIGEYIARMDADDISMPERLEKQYNFMVRNADVGILGMQAEKIDETGCSLGITKKPLYQDHIVKYACFACPLIHPTWFIRKSVYINLDYYKNMSPAQDYHFISKALKNKIIINNLPDVGIIYTVRTNSVSRSSIYKTLTITNLIRDAISKKRSNDKKIDAILSGINNAHTYLNVLYRLRSIFLTKFKNNRSSMEKFLYSALILLVSSMCILLLRDTISVYRSTKISLLNR